MSNDPIYFVWRRNDGYVDSTCGHMPQEWKVGNVETSFVKLAETTDWRQARRIIDAARENPNYVHQPR